jgi:hypothetical protein
MTNPTSNFGWQMPTSTDLVTDLPADFEVFGQAVDTSLADLKGGTSGQILAKNSNTDMDFVWIANDQGDITGVTASSPLTGGGTSGAITVGIQDASTSQKGAVQLTDSTSTTSSTVAATATAVKSAYDLATTASTNVNNITMVQQYTATESVLKNVPSRIPAAEQLLKQAVYWIDAAQSDNSDQVLDNQGWGAPALTTQLGSTTSADSNDPKFLDFDGINYVYTPGGAVSGGTPGNLISIPDSAVLDITGDIDIRCKIACDDWTPAAAMYILSKYATGGNLSYVLQVNTAGTFTLTWSANGSTSISATSTVANTITDGAVKWVRATLDVDNGASGNDVKFYTSDDGVTYTQLGATVTTAGVTSIYAGTSEVALGQRNTYDANASFVGKYYRAQILNGIDGTKVLDVDTSVIGSGSATSFSALTGQTCTIYRYTSGKKTTVVTHPVWLFGTDDYMTVANNDLLNFGATDSMSVVCIFRTWSTFTNGDHLMMKATGTNGYDFWTSATGVVYQPYGGAFPVAEQAITSGTLNSAVGVRNVSTDLIGISINGAALTTATDTTTTTLTNTQPLVIGAASGLGAYVDMELIAAAVFRRVLTATEISTINNYYTARVGA